MEREKLCSLQTMENDAPRETVYFLVYSTASVLCDTLPKYARTGRRRLPDAESEEARRTGSTTRRANGERTGCHNKR